jgi:excinuclease UvrABC nuclease subunit
LNPKLNQGRKGATSNAATPPVKGVYLILDRYDQVQYVGKSNNLSRRLMEHLDNGDIGDARRFMAYQTRTENAALKLEKKLIRSYCPPYNIRDTADCYERVEE